MNGMEILHFANIIIIHKNVLPTLLKVLIKAIIFFFQTKELDNFFATLDGYPPEKKQRRESSSLVDEFFQDDKNAPELLSAKQRMSML
jgi:hypothetical protein